MLSMLSGMMELDILRGSAMVGVAIAREFSCFDMLRASKYSFPTFCTPPLQLIGDSVTLEILQSP